MLTSGISFLKCDSEYVNDEQNYIWRYTDVNSELTKTSSAGLSSEREAMDKARKEQHGCFLENETKWVRTRNIL